MTGNGNMETRWRTIASAPRDGSQLLLCIAHDEAAQFTGMSRHRWSAKHHCVVGKWQTAVGDIASHWISDLTSMDYLNETPCLLHDPINPTHWLSLPAAPPAQGWRDGLNELPSLNTLALIYDNRLTDIKGTPMLSPNCVSSGDNMTVGCLVNDQANFLPLWASDILEICDGFDNEGPDVDRVQLPTPYWFEIPPPPNDL